MDRFRSSQFSNSAQISRDALIVLVVGILIGCSFMYYALKTVTVVRTRKHKSKSKNVNLNKRDKTDELLASVQNNVSSYTEKGIKFTSITEAENFKTAMLHRQIKNKLKENQMEKQKAKKRIYLRGGSKLNHARELIDKNKFDMADTLIRSVLKNGGNGDPYIRMAAYRYLADVYHGKGDVKKYSLMMYKYFKELEKNNINGEKLETIVNMKSDLMKTIQRIKKK